MKAAQRTFSSREFNQDTGRAKKAAKAGPVIITDRGEPAFVLQTYADFNRRETGGKSLAEALYDPAAAEIEIEFPRIEIVPREVDWS